MSDKTFYDYFVIALPVLTGLSAWLASAIQNSITEKRKMLKDKYYQSKNNVIERPAQSCHPFRFKLAGHSGLKLPPVPA